MERLRTLLDGLRSYWENLTDRERRLLAVLGAVAGALLILLPVYLLSTSIGDLERENSDIVQALRRISHSRGRLAAERAAQLAADQRYARRAPSLGSFLEAKAGETEGGVTITDVQHEPEREVGHFRIRDTRVRLQNLGLRPAILFLASIENSRYPVAIERLHVDHHQAGDQYNLQVGVLAYDRQGGESDEDGAGGGNHHQESGSGRGTAGPPDP